ncbi:MAG TPA: GTP-binding protein, partial [Chitinophagaceae bacterium]|nr:GTP-binding protein [Chitinophagaceae bacterium]
MADFDTTHVKNIVLLGHAGTGKTTLAECMLYEAGLITRRGSIAEKNTVADYHPLEQERGNSIFSKLLHTQWKGYKINIIDTPGFDDFSGEVISALRVADTGVMLLNAAEGVEVGSDIIWEYTENFKTPMLFAVNKLDHEKADFDSTVAQAKNHFGANVAVVQYPINQGPEFNAIIDVLKMTMYKFPATGGKPEKLPIPDGERARADKLHQELVESVAVNDETLMEHYLEKGELDEDEMRIGLKKSLINHDIFPVFCLSGERDMGSGRLMSFIDNVCPSANEMPPQTTRAGEALPCDANGPACIFVFKTMSEPHVGELSYFKVYSGTIRAGMELVNESTGSSEKISQLFIVEGNKRQNVQELVAGDIGATLKLKNTHVNNTLHVKGKNVELDPIKFPTPNMTVSIEPINKGEEEKLAIALHALREEDPAIIIEVSPELHQTLIRCQGDMHLAVAKWKIEHSH